MKQNWMLVTAIALLTTPAYADQDKKGALVCSNVSQPEFMEKIRYQQDKFLKKLKLDKDQDERVKKIRESYQDKLFIQVKKIRGTHSEFMGAVEKDAANDDIRTSHATLMREKNTLHEMKFDMMLAIREVLTAPQRQKGIVELKEKMRDMCD